MTRITGAEAFPASRAGRPAILVARAGLAIATVLFTLAAVPLAARPAVAAPTAAPAAAPVEVLVSSDGVHFTPGLRGALIGSGDALVPGASVSTELWVRNPAPMPADLRISVGDIAETSPDFAAAVTLTAWQDGAAEATPIPLAELPSWGVLLEPGTLQPGETTRFRFRFAMADVTGGTGQRESAALTLVVAMREAAAGARPAADGDAAAPGGEPASSGFLAHTGFAQGAAAPLAAALLVGAGVALATTRRRSSTDD